MTGFVTCGLDDSLGNQMFQIAVVLKYSKSHNKSPVFFTSNGLSYGNLQTFKKEEQEKYNFREVKVKNCSDYMEIPQIDENIILSGNFASFEYLTDHIRDKIQDIFFSNEDMMYYTYDLYKQIKKEMNSEIDDDYVTVHVEKSNLQDKCYYEKAYDIVSQMIASNGAYGPKKVIVFSDDIEWCRQNFNIDNATNTYFVQEKDAHIQMILMTFFTHNILSNSSLSWWGSYLSNNKDKIVIFPSQSNNNVRVPQWIIV